MSVASRTPSRIGTITSLARMMPWAGSDGTEPDVAVLVDPGAVARVDDRGRVELLDDRRAGELGAGAEAVPVVDRAVDEAAALGEVDGTARPLARLRVARRPASGSGGLAIRPSAVSRRLTISTAPLGALKP